MDWNGMDYEENVKRTKNLEKDDMNMEKKREDRELEERSPSPKRKRNPVATMVPNLNENVPKYLVVSKIEGDFFKDNPFFVDRTMRGIIQFRNLKKFRGGLLVETNSVKDSLALLKLKKFGPYDVKVSAHSTMNLSKGVVTCRDLLNCPVDVIKSELSSQQVSDVRRITTRRDGVIQDTPSLILTFNTPHLPSHIIAGFYSLKVRPYIPSPLRCFRCQKFGHTANYCKQEQVCVCGRRLHEGSSCVEPLVCVNCSGSHNARSKNCPVYKSEMLIQELRVKEKISYPEARRKVENTLPRTPTGLSYAQVTKSVAPSAPSLDVDQLISKMLPAIVSALTDIFSLPKKTPKPDVAPSQQPASTSKPPRTKSKKPEETSTPPDSATESESDTTEFVVKSNTSSKRSPHVSRAKSKFKSNKQ
jgi:hypothetical protein